MLITPGKTFKLKILHIISDLRRGGRERQLAVLTSCSDPDIENHILAFHKTENNYLGEYNLNVSYYNRKGKFKRFSAIINYIKKNKIDLIHTWGNSETLYALPAARLCKVHLLNGSIRHGVRLNTFSHRFRSLVLKKSGYIMANSYAGFEANKIKINKYRHFVIYNGIEEKFFTSFDEKKRKDFNLKHNLPPEAVIFITIANFVPYKDYATIIKSLSELKSKEFPFHYIIIGKGPMLNEIKKLITKSGLDSNISIFSDNPDILFLLSISDIMIHSSLGEGCSNAILEASAAGLIVVASDTGGTKEIINEWSFLFGYKNKVELIEKIKEAVQLKNNYPEVRNKIQAATKERFSVESFVKNYNEVVNKILSNKK